MSKSTAGYDTGYIGKWHLYANQLGNHYDPKNSFVPRGPDRLGFDGYWAAYNFRHDYYNAYYHTESPEKIFYGKGVFEPDVRQIGFVLALNWVCFHQVWNWQYFHIPLLLKRLRSFGHLENWVCFA